MAFAVTRGIGEPRSHPPIYSEQCERLIVGMLEWTGAPANGASLLKRVPSFSRGRVNAYKYIPSPIAR